MLCGLLYHIGDRNDLKGTVASLVMCCVSGCVSVWVSGAVWCAVWLSGGLVWVWVCCGVAVGLSCCLWVFWWSLVLSLGLVSWSGVVVWWCCAVCRVVSGCGCLGVLSGGYTKYRKKVLK